MDLCEHIFCCGYFLFVFQNPSDAQGVFKAGANITAISDLIAVCQDMISLN